MHENQGDEIEDLSIAEGNENLSDKAKMKALYNKLANEAGNKSIEEYYTSKKFKLSMSGDMSQSDKVQLDILNSIAKDMGWGGVSKEFTMAHNLGSKSSIR